jgi:hypothetical protein
MSAWAKSGHSGVCYSYKKYKIASSALAIKTTTSITACRANFQPASAARTYRHGHSVADPGNYDLRQINMEIILFR